MYIIDTLKYMYIYIWPGLGSFVLVFLLEYKKNFSLQQKFDQTTLTQNCTRRFWFKVRTFLASPY